jgi:hypothetical protein
MSLTATVTPGYAFAVGETVTEEKLNQLGSPVVAVTGDAATIAQPNLFSNGDLSIWTRGAGPVSCPLDTATFLADQWFVRPRKITGGTYDDFTATYQKETDAVYGTQLYRARAGFGSKTGSITAEIEFCQRRLARVTTKLADKFVIACELENQTGTAYRPKARIYTCASADSYVSVNAQETVSGTAATGSNTLGNGERRLFYFTFTAASYDAALKLGGEICIVIPETAAGAGYTRIYGPLKLETGDTPTTREPERDPSGEQTTSASTSTAAVDYLFNGTFEPSRFPAFGAAVNVSTETEVADAWLAKTAAGTATSQLDSTAPDTKSSTALKFTGAIGVDVLTVRQRIYADAAGTAKRPLVFSAWVRNGTGASLTPTFRVLTCDNFNDFQSVSVAYSTATAAIANGDYTRVSVLFDPTVYSNLTNGFIVELTFPAGSMNAGTKTIRIAQASLLPGLALADWQAVPATGCPPRTDFRNLKIVRGGGSSYQVTITADEVVMAAADGRARVYKAVSCTADLSASGVSGLDTGTVANSTEYYLYLVANDQQVLAVFSTSATAPTGIENGPYKARISNFKTCDASYASGNPYVPFGFQRDRIQAYVVEAPSASAFLRAVDATLGTSLSAVSVTGIPSTAVAVGGYAGVSIGGGKNALMTISGDSVGYGSVNLNIPGGAVWNLIYGGASFRVPLSQVANLYLAGTTTGSPKFSAYITQIEIA